MIREIGVELQAELRERGVPFPVVNGPEPTTTTTWGRERIVIEYDDQGADSFGAPRSQSKNPKRRFSAFEACKITIYAQSVGTGSALFEHRRRAKAIRNRVMCALEEVAAKRQNGLAIQRGRFIVPPDLEGAERHAGAVYEISFAYEDGIPDLKWDGAKRPEGNITRVGSTTEVHGVNGSGAGETACGS